MRSAHQAESLASLSVGQLASAAAFFQAERRLHHARVRRHRRARCCATGRSARPPSSSASTGRERAAFEREPRRPDLRTRRRGGRCGRAARPVYFPVTYAVSELRRLGAPVGYDVGADPVRGPLPASAPRDSGQPADDDRRDRAAARRHRDQRLPPVYRDGAPTATVGRAPAALVGFAGGAFRVRNLAAAAIGSRAGRRRRAAADRPTALWSAPRARSKTRPRRRSRSPTAPGCWSSATRTGPASACRC